MSGNESIRPSFSKDYTNFFLFFFFFFLDRERGSCMPVLSQFCKMDFTLKEAQGLHHIIYKYCFEGLILGQCVCHILPQSALVLIVCDSVNYFFGRYSIPAFMLLFSHFGHGPRSIILELCQLS